MAAKAYVVSMTVTELKEELKQRGLSTRGSKKSLRDRLEQALYDEELDDPSSESETESTSQMFGQGLGQSGFNFEVPPESFIAEEDIVPDDEEDDPDYIEPMIVSVQLSDREKLKVCPRASATSRMPVGIEDRSMGDRSLEPMIVAIEIGNRNTVAQSSEKEETGGENEEEGRMKRDAQLLTEPVSVIKATAPEESVARSKPTAKATATKRKKSADLAASQKASAPVAVTSEVDKRSDKSVDVSVNGKRDTVEKMEQLSLDSATNITNRVEERPQEQPVQMQIEQKIELPQAISEVQPPPRQDSSKIQPSQTSNEIETPPTSSKVQSARIHTVEEKLAPPPPESMATEAQTTCETAPPLISKDERQTSDQESSLRVPQQQEDEQQRQLEQKEQHEEAVSYDGEPLQMEAETVNMKEGAQSDGVSDLTEAQALEKAVEGLGRVESEDKLEHEPERQTEDEQSSSVQDISTSQQVVETPTSTDMVDSSLPQSAIYESDVPQVEQAFESDVHVSYSEEANISPSKQSATDGAREDSITSTSELCREPITIEEKKEDLAGEGEMEKQPSPPPPLVESSGVSEQQVLEEEKYEEPPLVAVEEVTSDVLEAGESEKRTEEERAQPMEEQTSLFEAEAEGELEDKSQEGVEKLEDKIEGVATQDIETPPPEAELSPLIEHDVTGSDRLAEVPVEEEEPMDAEPTFNEPTDVIQREETSSAEKSKEQVISSPEILVRECTPEQEEASMEEPIAPQETDQVEADEKPAESEVAEGDMELSKSTPRSPLSIEVEPPSVFRDDIEADQLPLEETESVAERTDDVSGDLLEYNEEEEAAVTDEVAPVVSPRPTQDEETAVGTSGPTQKEVEEGGPFPTQEEGDEETFVVSPRPTQEELEKGSPGPTQKQLEKGSPELTQEEGEEGSPVGSPRATQEEGEEGSPVVSPRATQEEGDEGSPIPTQEEGDQGTPFVTPRPTQDEDEDRSPGLTKEETDERTSVSTPGPMQQEITGPEPMQEQVTNVVSPGPIREEFAEGTPISTPESTHEEEQTFTTADEDVPAVNYEPTYEEKIGDESIPESLEEMRDTAVVETAPFITSESTHEEEHAADIQEDVLMSEKRESVSEDSTVFFSESTREEQRAAVDEVAPLVTSESTYEDENATTDKASAVIPPESNLEEQEAHTTVDDEVSSETTQVEVAPVISPQPVQEKEEGTPITDVLPSVITDPIQGDEEEVTAIKDVLPIVIAEPMEKERGATVDECAPVISSETCTYDNQGAPDVDTTAKEKELKEVLDPTNQPQPLDEPSSATDVNPDELAKQEEGTSLTGCGSGGGEYPVNPVTTTAAGETEREEGEGQVEVSRESGLLETGQIEVDVLLHAEEDDLSVFSAEAAEADKALTLSSSSQSTGTRRKTHPHHHPASSSSAGVPPSSSSGRRSSKSSSNVSTSLDKASPVVSSATSASQAAATGSSTVARRASLSSSGAAEVSSISGEKRQRPEKIEVSGEPPFIKRRRISAHGSASSSGNAKDGATPTSGSSGGISGSGQEKKRRWGKQRASSTSAANISSDVLKDIIPADVEVLMNDDQMEVGVDTLEEAEHTGEGEENPTQNGDGQSAEDKEWDKVEKERELKKAEVERARQELETRRRIEARLKAKQEAEAKTKVMRRTPSPARNPPSRILHVDHLTRPFTRIQLQELLTENGNIIKDAFWTNRIKSHCIAVYESLDAAVATRARLHGLKWPSTNSKFLAVDFLTPADVSRISEGQLEVSEMGDGEEEAAATTVTEGGETGKMETNDEVTAPQSPSSTLSKSHPPKEETEHLEDDQVKGHDKPRQQERASSTEKRRPSQDKVKKEEVEEEQLDYIEEEATAATKDVKATKLLDELFRKTKATPSIYWLPLTDAQVMEREAEEKARAEEREKRRLERIRLRQEEREKEEKEREKRLAIIRERRAKERERERERDRERMRRRRSRTRSRSRSKPRSRSRSRSRDRDRRRR